MANKRALIQRRFATLKKNYDIGSRLKEGRMSRLFMLRIQHLSICNGQAYPVRPHT